MNHKLFMKIGYLSTYILVGSLVITCSLIYGLYYLLNNNQSFINEKIFVLAGILLTLIQFIIFLVCLFYRLLERHVGNKIYKPVMKFREENPNQ